MVLNTTLVSVAIAAATTLGGLGAVYADLVGRDREQTVRIEQVRNDVMRIERDTRDLRGDIRNDLSELKSEVRQLRDALASRPPR